MAYVSLGISKKIKKKYINECLPVCMSVNHVRFTLEARRGLLIP